MKKLAKVCTGKARTNFGQYNLRALQHVPPRPPKNYSIFPDPDKNSVPINLMIPIWHKGLSSRIDVPKPRPIRNLESDSD